MSANDTRRAVRELLASVAGADLVASIADGDLIFEHGLIDSLHLIELLESIQARFGFEVATDELAPENFESVDAMTRYIEAKTAA